MQAEALALVGRKLRAALLVEGELPQEGLATQELDDGDLLLALAKRLAAGERADTQALEALFAESRALETGAGETLGGAAWAEPDEPARPRDVPDQQASATTAITAPTQQLVLPTLLVAPPSLRSDATTVPGEGDLAKIPTPIQHQPAPKAPELEDAFIPSAGKVVSLTGWLGLTAPPAPPRRRKQPARDQLKLFG